MASIVVFVIIITRDVAESRYECPNTIYPFSLEGPAPGFVFVRKEFVVKARLDFPNSVAIRDGQQIDAKSVERMAQKLSVVVQLRGGSEMRTKYQQRCLFLMSIQNSFSTLLRNVSEICVRFGCEIQTAFELVVKFIQSFLLFLI